MILGKTFVDFLHFSGISLELDYYHQKVDVRVASWIADFRILGN